MKCLPVCEPLLAGNELRYVTDAIETGWISSSGKYVTEFEKAFAAYCGVRHGIAVCNGTVALHLALVALGVGPGDEVIIPDFTMIASAFAVCYTGATPVFADADPDTWNISAKSVEAKITPRTKVCMPVHIFGNPCDMAALQAAGGSRRFTLMEDAAEAHGAEFGGHKAGTLSKIAGFSFFANKNITTGEGGMVVTDDDGLARACRYHKNLCFPLDSPRTYLHDRIGFNYRMSNVHAAIGLAQVEKADYYRDLRTKNGLLYRELLSLIPGIRLQKEQPGGRNVFWMNGLCTTPAYGRSRDELVAHLKEHGIETRLFFNGMHRQPALQKYGCDCTGDYPVSDFLADNGLYIPSGGGLTEQDICRVCGIIGDFRRVNMTVFADYARYYNLLYRDKDYAGEADFVLACLQKAGCAPHTLLDLGCGTGRHALDMTERGVAVAGVDMSETMLAMGRDKMKATNISQKVPVPMLYHGDARTVRLGKKFDAVVSLFHVMSYQLTEADALSVLETAREHLISGGVFLFDFWYGPGVLTDPPTKRKKIMEDTAIRVIRQATPVHRVSDNVVEVHYRITIMDKATGHVSELTETHPMRYWFLPELRHLVQTAGFAVLTEGAWLAESMPEKTTWNAWMSVQRNDKHQNDPVLNNIKILDSKKN